ncbi:pseudouridine synthase [Thalassospiraceae bacterium LMO-JJ14]|nr:pseudouridine synthase [Thalassospiraceae bacterium LMO-JJ14]
MAKKQQTASTGERIAKVMARAGLCSRREAERWIEEGRVEVNGQKLTTPACVVGETDTIVVDGKTLPTKEPTRLWRYNKPAGLVTSHKDPQGRPTVFAALPAHLPRVISVGRLDFNSEGLLLLTNDGELARKLELPETGWTRRYRIRVHGNADTKQLLSLGHGVTVDGVKYGPVTANFDSRTGANAWMTVTLKEGKNREVRKVMEHIGLTVNRLIRTAYGPFQIGHLPQGEVEEIRPKALREQVGMLLK